MAASSFAVKDGSAPGGQGSLASTSAPASASASAAPASSAPASSARPPLPLLNRAASSKSPFIQGLASSPVKWQLLDSLSVDRAKRENKLIFLHIGFKSCHFCRLMARESFSHGECAAILNDSFVPVIVDREQRPDIDAIYMNYIQAVNKVGGWPLNLFLTPQLEPVFGGTYWPGPRPSSSHLTVHHHHDDETPDFLTILRKLRATWIEQQARCRLEASEIVGQLREFAAEGTLGARGLGTEQTSELVGGRAGPQPDASTRGKSVVAPSELDLDQLEEAFTHIAGSFDPVCGGFGLAPKFLTPPKLAFMLQLDRWPTAVQDVVGQTECKQATDMVLFTLRKIRDGALHDHIGGTGFSRCSVTPDWTVPNFEKLVVDNALLLGLFVDAWKIQGGQPDCEFYHVVLELASYLSCAPILLPHGGLASSEAADSYHRHGDKDMREGACYLWTRPEFESVFVDGDESIGHVAAAHWNILDSGNIDELHKRNGDFAHQNVPCIVKTPDELARQFSLPAATVERYVALAKRKLRGRRQVDRVRPDIDDKAVAGYNGLAISALARTAAALRAVNPEMADTCLATAKSAVRFIKDKLWDANAHVLYRIWKDGRETEGFADDYAYVIQGLLDVNKVSSDESLVALAHTLQKTQIHLFHDHAAGAFFCTRAGAPHVVLRLKDGIDTALPATNAVSAQNLFRLAALLDTDADTSAHYDALARATVDAFEAEILQHPWLFPGLLGGIVVARLGLQQ
ncbi:hypothetical protein CDD81_3674 [Ophiocordyceps australis]|uniref:Spermatogenesis-associated protein 20-like TRX domain-containing protein n=1 Tax=Ophiocordyceps australis TaxID=1399860 RepID=A0A2C5XW40_9HYPO|nr:hypothetical protein CDD81_3674 [Ophiocordyceps australis]